LAFSKQAVFLLLNLELSFGENSLKHNAVCKI